MPRGEVEERNLRRTDSRLGVRLRYKLSGSRSALGWRNKTYLWSSREAILAVQRGHGGRVRERACTAAQWERVGAPRLLGAYAVSTLTASSTLR